MSKLLKFSESLGKSNLKKWSQIWNLLLIKGVKSPRVAPNEILKKYNIDFEFLVINTILGLGWVVKLQNMIYDVLLLPHCYTSTKFKSKVAIEKMKWEQPWGVFAIALFKTEVLSDDTTNKNIKNF